MIAERVRVLVVEDKAIVAKDICTSLQDIGYEVVETADNGLAAIEKTLALKPDLLLLDINIKGDLDGIEVADQINKKYQVPIIYLTAYSDNVTLQRAKNTNPYAYIVKPFDDKDLRIAIDLAIHNFGVYGSKTGSKSHETNNYIIKDSIFIKSENRYHKVHMDNILYVAASGSYIDIFLEDAKHTLSINLQHFENRMNNEAFMRVHRSYIVNLNKVDSFETARLYIGELMVPVSKAYREQVHNRFHQI